MPVGERVRDFPELSFEDFNAKLAALTIRALSPDRSVRLIVDAQGRRVSFGHDGTEGHTEHSLAAQLTAVLQAGEHGHQRAMSILIAQAAGVPVPDAPRAEYERERVSVVVESPRGSVRIRRTADRDGFEARIQPNTLGSLGLHDEQLLTEINAAVTAAESEFRRRFDLAHRPDRKGAP